MEKADVVVVGAGPAGSSAAYFLAKQGVDVALLEKNEFPREKTCGDGLGPRSLQVLDKMGLNGWLNSSGYYRCDRVRMFASTGEYFEANIPESDTRYPHFVIIPRKDLDQKLADTVASTGGKVLTGCKAVAPVIASGTVKGIKARYKGEEIEIACNVIISADGTHGTFATQTGLDVIKPHAFAVRAYYDNVKGLDDCINIYVDEHIPEGYAWIFPTSKTSANIGLGVSTPMLKNKNVDIKALQDWFLTKKSTYPIDLSEATPSCDVKGAYLRMGYGRHSTVANGILLAGDAAGLISPLTGEGIAYALESGELAANAVKTALDEGDVSSSSLKSYEDRLNKDFYMNHRLYEFFRQGLANYKRMDRMIVQGKKHAPLASKFASMMMSTAEPTAMFRPRMLLYYLF